MNFSRKLFRNQNRFTKRSFRAEQVKVFSPANASTCAGEEFLLAFRQIFSGFAARCLLLAVALIAVSCSVKLAFASPDDPKAGADPMLAAKAAAKGDPVLDALIAELERSKSQLKMDQL